MYSTLTKAPKHINAATLVFNIDEGPEAFKIEESFLNRASRSGCPVPSYWFAAHIGKVCYPSPATRLPKT